MKATGILTNASWMKVCALCHEVRAHYHLRGGLVGVTWLCLEEPYVWRASLAAEYPCGLTIAWRRALLEWLNSDEGNRWQILCESWSLEEYTCRGPFTVAKAKS